MSETKKVKHVLLQHKDGSQNRYKNVKTIHHTSHYKTKAKLDIEFDQELEPGKQGTSIVIPKKTRVLITSRTVTVPEPIGFQEALNSFPLTN